MQQLLKNKCKTKHFLYINFINDEIIMLQHIMLLNKK